MIFPARILLLACIAAASSAGEEPDQNDLKTAATATATTNSSGSNSSSSSTGAPPPEPKDVSILKQINKVNDDGSYTYGYEASDGSFKVETRDVAGNVKGMFGFVDEAGRLKRVSYSANNSSGFQTAGSSTSSPPSPSPPPHEALAALSSVQTIPPRRKKDDDEANEPTTKSTGGVKKVLVSKRPIPVAAPPQDDVDRRRGGNDLRRQLPANDDAPDVYGIHGRSSLHSAPVSPVVSALMSELDPIRAYNSRRVVALPTTTPYDQPATAPTTQFVLQDTISRQAQEDDGDEPPPPSRYQRPVQQQQQQLYRGGGAAGPYQPAVYPVLPLYQQQQQQQQQQQPAVVYGPNLASLRDELMELILSFVQARVSQLMPYAPQPYSMPYQVPNYYVPSYYQGPRVQGSPVGLSATAAQQRQQLLLAQQQRQRLLLAQQQQDDDYATAAGDPSQQQSSPRVTQTLKDGLIRMLLSTSPRYDSDRTGDGDERSGPRFTYRRTTQSTPVRNVQVIGEDRAIGSSRPVTTETPD